VKAIVKQSFWLLLLPPGLAFLCWAFSAGPMAQQDRVGNASHARPLRIVVMDPLSDQLACDCVEGYAQRKYDELGAFLEKQLAQPVRIAYGENLADILKLNPGKSDLIIGKQSVVLFDAAEINMAVRPIARLTDKSGSTDLRGLFVVRKNDPAESMADLKSYRILLGPECDAEKSIVARAALKAQGIPLAEQISTSPSCSSAALAVVEEEADAGVISSYALALLEGCDTIDKGALRIVGQTSGVPFITVFATDAVTRKSEAAVIDALLAVNNHKSLLAEMESKAGFIRIREEPLDEEVSYASGPLVAWTDWRGANRDGTSPYVPKRLPTKPRFLWRRPLTGMGLSGIAATPRYVIAADKSKDKKSDIFRCLNADTGEEIWIVEYSAPGEMDFTNSPRANPVIDRGLVYLLGAFGDLHCARLETGKIIWKKNIIKNFGAELPAWGMCSTPLMVGDTLIVNPGTKDASIVALDRQTGNVFWKTSGEPAAYSSFILGTFGNVRQIVGYDAISLGGWDPNSGKRLWKLLPEEEGDFNVPTPINIDGKLLAASENNGTRLYDFDNRGKIKPRPVAQNLDLAPDSSTPVVINGLVFGCFGGLYCLDTRDSLKTLYSVEDDDAFYDYAALIAGSDRVLVITVEGELLLIGADHNRYTLVSRLRLFEETEVWSHPAVVGNHLYIRSTFEICCLLLDES